VAYDPENARRASMPRRSRTSVPGIYVVGAAITGRNSGQIFIENGRLHGQQAIDVIARRLRAAF
jgi:thioredoxin reductase